MKKIKLLSFLLSIITLIGMLAPAAFAAQNTENADKLSSAVPYMLRSELVNKEDNTVKIWLELDPSIAENVASYQLAVQLQNVNSETAQGRKMTLKFDESFQNAKIKATKYDKDTQTLRIYVADKENLVQTLKNEDNNITNILPIGTVKVEKKNKTQNPFKITLFGNDGELAVADLGCNVKKAAEVYGKDGEEFVIPVDGTVYGASDDTKPVETTDSSSGKDETSTDKTDSTAEKTESTEPSSENPSETDEHPNCSCICHKTGFMSIFYKILRFFWKLFSKNQFCTCGAAHY